MERLGRELDEPPKVEAEAEELNRRLRRVVVGLGPDVLRDLDHETRELLGWELGNL